MQSLIEPFWSFAGEKDMGKQVQTGAESMEDKWRPNISLDDHFYLIRA